MKPSNLEQKDQAINQRGLKEENMTEFELPKNYILFALILRIYIFTAIYRKFFKYQ